MTDPTRGLVDEWNDGHMADLAVSEDVSESEARKSAMSRDRAIDHMDNMLKGVADWDTRGARSKRGLLDNFETWEAVTGEQFPESLEDACREMEEYDILAIGKWLLS